MALVHKTKKEEGKKHKTKRKHKKKQQIFRIKLRKDRFRMFGPHSKPILAVSAWFKANFALFRLFQLISAVSQYDLIRPIQPDFGWISPVRHELKLSWCELELNWHKLGGGGGKKNLRCGINARVAAFMAVPYFRLH